MFDIGSYREARTREEALSELAQNQKALVIAGGTDVLIRVRERKAGYTGRDLVGITRIPGLREIRQNQEGLFIGSCATFDQIERDPQIADCFPALAQAVGTVGGPQIRAMGTLGGNICNGAPSADSLPILWAANGILRLESLRGMREVPIQEFALGPGRVALEPGELLTAIRIRPEDYQGYRGYYVKFSARNAMDIATLGCGVWIRMEKTGLIQDLRIAFGVAGPTPLRATEAEALAVGMAITEENLQAIGEACLKSTRARDSWRASKAFRENLIQELPQRAISLALQEEARDNKNIDNRP